MANPFCHVELNTTDLDKSVKFYTHLFDWKLEPFSMGPDTYHVIKVGEGTGGGMMKHPVPGAPSTWLAYVLVGDIKTSTAKAKQLGAKVLQESVEVPNMGWFSIVTDPAGATFGMWQAKDK